ncbi:hypothetical protein CQW23_34197 [Capsicum baccatum]|uniref:Uncharacterized protein n=1 Tax=Capsicum baccatum TaxID=33114 RepID=A0A2G2UZL3_CAPBA|nr:hypothetical protein CQW23_34197 [Capsicum baccatum]
MGSGDAPRSDVEWRRAGTPLDPGRGPAWIGTVPVCQAALVPWCLCDTVPWFHGAAPPCCYGAKVPRCHGAMVPWCLGAMAPRCLGARVPWCHGAMAPRCHGATMPWRHAALVPRCTDIQLDKDTTMAGHYTSVGVRHWRRLQHCTRRSQKPLIAACLHAPTLFSALR